MTNTAASPLPRIDFVDGAVGYRLRQGEGRRSPLARAAGFAPSFTPTVIDATAGLGRSALQLAALGARVTMIERSAPVHALLADALARGREEAPEVMGRMTLIHGDAREVLAHLPEEARPDVVLVDPMHPPRAKSALVKQELRLLRDLVGPDEDALELMQAALKAARRRVVLKWPLRAAAMPGLRAASHQILTKTLRYDVFMVG